MQMQILGQDHLHANQAMISFHDIPGSTVPPPPPTVHFVPPRPDTPPKDRLLRRGGMGARGPAGCGLASSRRGGWTSEGVLVFG